MKKILYLSYFFFLFEIQAQIVTPSLDGTKKSEQSTALNWMTKSTISIHGMKAEGSFEEKGDISNTTNQKNGTQSITSSPAILGAFKHEAFSAQLYSIGSKNYEKEYEDDSTTNKRKENEFTLKLGYLITENIGVSVGYTKFKIDYENDYEENEENLDSYDIGLGLQFKGIFLALGQIQTKESETRDDNLKVDDLNYTSTYYGIAFILGKPEDFRLRGEYSVINIPETKEKAEALDEKGNIKPKTHISYTSLEIGIDSFFISGQLKNETFELEIETKETGNMTKTNYEKTTLLVGTGWSPQKGIAIGAYYWNSNDEIKTKSINGTISDKISPQGYKLHVGYSF